MRVSVCDSEYIDIEATMYTVCLVWQQEFRCCVATDDFNCSVTICVMMMRYGASYCGVRTHPHMAVVELIDIKIEKKRKKKIFFQT